MAALNSTRRFVAEMTLPSLIFFESLLSARTALGTEIWIAEHWIVGNGQLQQLRVFYDDTRSIKSVLAPTAS